MFFSESNNVEMRKHLVQTQNFLFVVVFFFFFLFLAIQVKAFIENQLTTQAVKQI
jgi:hypothetical protein